jgi:hypothetical protein
MSLNNKETLCIYNPLHSFNEQRVFRNLDVDYFLVSVQEYTVWDCNMLQATVVSYLYPSRKFAVCFPKSIQLTNSVAPEPEGSSPHSQQPANGPYPEPGESTSHTLTPASLPKVYYNPILPSTPRSSK